MSYFNLNNLNNNKLGDSRKALDGTKEEWTPSISEFCNVGVDRLSMIDLITLYHFHYFWTKEPIISTKKVN